MISVFVLSLLCYLFWFRGYTQCEVMDSGVLWPMFQHVYGMTSEQNIKTSRMAKHLHFLHRGNKRSPWNPAHPVPSLPPSPRHHCQNPITHIQGYFLISYCEKKCCDTPCGITPINQPGSLILGIKQNMCFICLWGMILWMAMFVVYRCAVSCPVF